MPTLITEAKQRSNAVTAAEKKKAEAEKARLLVEEQQRQHDEATTRATDEERNIRHEKVFGEERVILTMAAQGRREAETGELRDNGLEISLLLSHLTNLLATCIAQREDIHCLNDVVKDHKASLAQVNSRLQQLEQRPVAATDVTSSNHVDRLHTFEIDVGTLKDGAQLQQVTTQQLEQQIYPAATGPSTSLHESIPKFEANRSTAACRDRNAQHYAHRYTYLSSYAPPTSPTDDEAAVGYILAYITKVAREFRTQWYKDNNAPLLYVRIQVGQASCSALLDSGATRNFMSESCIQRAGLGAQVRRKANATAIKLASIRAQQLIDRYIEAIPVYFAPHACEPVTFDVLDTDFDIILGMPWLASANHTVNFHQRTLTIRDAFGLEVPCTIPLPHPLIRCQVVTAKSFRATCAYEQPGNVGLRFLRTVAVADSSFTGLSSEPRVVRLLDEFADIFESPTGVVPDRPISHEIILEAGVAASKCCIYRMSEEELAVLRAQLDDLLDKGWIRPSSSPYGAPVLFKRRKNKDLQFCIDYHKLNAHTIKNMGPLPCIDDLLEHLGTTQYFSKLDLKSGYHQMSIQPNDRYKSAFNMRYGHFEWVVMPFGLTNAPTTFEVVMDRFSLVYLDDILVYSRTLKDHLEHL
ncbi:hypothetical protein CBR_g34268 [Chara braunii]|uniref:Reverse transcriptase domain-containing protein n=1 Tax=Chara braunii TaxID=69332 RepID=A0A388JYN8_CHABU|nr:hypothetical protein CBR_g34268 [Chara braunii]|eukprot:GBG62896.1 hypothetical protein CBR_g34268 [Chara braunii]